MNNFDNSARPRGGGKNSNTDLIWNVLTGVMLIGTLCLVGYFAMVMTNPYSSLNLLQPPPLLPTPIPATRTPVGLDPTWTPTATTEPTVTNTPRPTFTLEPSATLFTLATATSAVSPTKTAKPTGVPYSAGNITYDDSTVWIKNSDCGRMYIVGQVFDTNRNPMHGLQVHLGGSVPGKVFNPPLTTLSGLATTFGPSGFEFDLNVQPVASTKTLWVQLYDEAGAPLSEQIFLATFNDCKKNLIFVHFQQK